MITETYKIHPSFVDYVLKQIAKFNRRCEKLNTGVAEVSFTEPYVVEENEQNKCYVDATLTYDIPVIDGWKLIARLDGFPGEDNLEVFANVVPGETLPTEYHEKHSIDCEHCGINRFRNHSILIQNVETGEYKEVGSTCVKDFFGHDPKGFMLYAGWNWDAIFEMGDVDGSYQYNGQWYNTNSDGLLNVLSMTAAVIEEHGWVPRSKEDEWQKTATSCHVAEQMNPMNMAYLRKSNQVITPTDDHVSLAKDTIEHFKSIEPTYDDSDYIWNCHKVAKLEIVPSRQFGLAVSMVAVYKRHIERELQEKREQKVSNWVGEIGEKIERRVQCVYTQTVDSYYGTSDLYIFIDESGNILKTFYSGSKWEMEQGEYATIKGTVKKHGEYKGKKDTMLTRVSATDIKAEEEEPKGDAFEKLETEIDSI